MTFTADQPDHRSGQRKARARGAYVVPYNRAEARRSLTRVDDHVGPVQGLGAVFPNVATDDPQAVFNGNNAGAGNIVKVYDNGVH